MNQLQFQSSIGNLKISWNTSGLLTRIDWDKAPIPPLLPQGASSDTTDSTLADLSWSARGSGPIPVAILGLTTRLQNYFHMGEPIGEIPWEALDQSRLTDFQKQVYYSLSKVPHGETRPYSWLAMRIGKARASRAVGQALKRNPFPILVPCHRVVATTTMGGFMGTSDPRNPEMMLKKRLLDLEQSYLNPVFPF